MVEQNRDCYGLNRCLEALRVAKSSWHYRQNGYGRPRAKEEEIEREIRQILEDHPDYGRPRMTVELRERLGYRINHKRVERLLRQNGWGMIRHIPRRSKSGVQQILHLDQTGLQGRGQIAFAKMVLMLQAKSFLEALPGHFTRHHP